MKTKRLLLLLLVMLTAPLTINAQQFAPDEPNYSTKESCAPPTNLNVSDITSSTATLNWNGDADSYDVRYGLFPANSTSQEWLTYDLTYKGAYGSSTASVRTRGVKYVAEQITGNVLTKVRFYDRSTNNTGGYVTINVYSGGDNAPGTLLYTETVYPAATGLLTFTLTNPVNIVRGENLWITLTELGTYTLYYGENCTDSNNRWQFVNNAWQIWATGQTNNYGWLIDGYMETVSYDNVSWTTGSCTENTYPLADLTDETVYVAQVRSNCGTETGVSEWTTTNFATPPCAMPAALTVSDITASTATLSWTGSSSSYDVRYGLYPTSSTSIGWLTYNVTQSGSVYGSASESTKTRAVKYRADEITGNLLTKIEFYEVLSYNTGGYTIFSIYSGGENAPGTLLYTEEIHPDVSGLQTVTLAQPVNIVEGENLWITMTEYGTYTFGVGECTDNDNRWILNGTVWNTWTVADKGWIINGYLETMNYNAVTWTTYSCTENTFQLTGLTETTLYLAQVRSSCGAGNGESVWATTDFMTTLPCVEPSDLEVSDITPESATLSWTGNANDYNVRYGLYEDAISEEKWLTYNVTLSSHYGSTTAYTRTRGVMYPAEQVTGNVLTKIEFYDNLNYNTGGNIIIRVYSGGEEAPGTLLYTETVVPITGMQTVTLAEPVNILREKNLWITFTETGTYTLSCGPCTDDNSRWYLNGSTWEPWATGQTNNLGWIINGYIETVNLDNIDWTTASCTEITYPMTGLNPDSYYIAQVQSFCGDEGKSDWVSTYFTTDAGLHFITDGNWNDGNNWYLGVVPPEGSSVTIKADAIIPSGYDAIVDNIALDGGSITIKDGGQLHSNVNIQATVEKEITGYTGEKDNYYLIANPLTANVNPANNSIATGTYDLYGFNGTMEREEWRNYEASAFNLTGGNGYLYANAEDRTLTFTGTVRKQYTNLFYNGTPLNYDETTPFGTWNLVGNMFPHNGYVYLGTIESGSVVYAAEMYYYKMNEDGDEVISTEGNEIVKPCEGIFVQSSAADQYAFFSAVKHNTNSKGLNMNLTKGDKLVDRAMLRFGQSHGLEKFQLNPNHSKVYIPKEGKDYAVMAADSQMGELPISFKAETNGSYTLSFTNEDVTFSYLHLIDNLTGIETDLLATPSYSFKAMTTDYANRFKLVFAANNGDGPSTGSGTFAFISNGNIIIDGEGVLQIVDMMGRVIANSDGVHTVSTNGMTPGVYVLRLINGDNVKVQKVVVK